MATHSRTFTKEDSLQKQLNQTVDLILDLSTKRAEKSATAERIYTEINTIHEFISLLIGRIASIEAQLLEHHNPQLAADKAITETRIEGYLQKIDNLTNEQQTKQKEVLELDSLIEKQNRRRQNLEKELEDSSSLSSS